MLNELSPLAPEDALRAGVLLIAAHPDDETIGVGALLPHLPNATVVHVTDGAPADRTWWGAPEMGTREAYARLRAEELARALDLAGVSIEHRRSLGRRDQRASDDLAGLARDVAALIAEIRPGVVLTHPYEGGHADHDAAAFAVHAARALLARDGAEPPLALEFASYHASGGGAVFGDFLPAPVLAVTRVLSEEERERKRRMMACFASQRETLAQFAVVCERFRAAPAYDFTRPPHEGQLYYERFDWGTTGEAWRARAVDALDALGIAEAARC